MDEARTLLKDVAWCKGPYEAMQGADAVTILTEWNEFRALDLKRARELLKQPVMIDLRNIYKPAEMAVAGFRYVSVGRGQTS
jgi:UDPglucose 6-dehydrogenase